MDIADDLTLYVGERVSQNEVGQVFIQDARNPERLVTLTSETGRFSLSDGRPLFVLRNGQRTELSVDGTSTASLSFETHALDIGTQTSDDAKRDIIDSNEETIFNLLNPPETIAPVYAAERKAMGHYRLASPFLGLCLAILATAVMLHGRILRETVNRRILIVALLGIVIQAGLILTRSMTASTPLLWPTMYLTVLIPMIAGLYMLWNPTAFLATGGQLSQRLALSPSRGRKAQ